jgi:hypothetical protein
MKRSSALLLVGGLLLAGCGGSKGSPTAPTTSTSTSTPAEPAVSQPSAKPVPETVHQAIFEVVLRLSGVPDRPPPPAGRFAMPQAVIEMPPLHDEEACPGGGLSSLDGTMRFDEGDDGTLEVSMETRIGFADCVWQGITLHGDPYLTLGITMSGDANAPAPARTTLQIKDAVAFTVEGVRGRVQYNCTQVTDLSMKVPETSGTIVWEYPAGTSVSGPSCSGS